MYSQLFSVLDTDDQASHVTISVADGDVTRIHMCTLAAEQTSSWLMLDPWEALQQSYQRTAIVLDHFDHEINEVLGGVRTVEGERKNVRVMLLAGSDLISTMSEPGVWSYSDVSHFLLCTLHDSPA
jgi:nicotinamide mononucleotide adenylyltransferase